ncbi:hypothetical protein OG453_23620 [Streptomyces sp. NBC_01381]|uniref:hypothetical protein n=1 Tax=Streptomyces sp. NBC_01381 TaxID=2903845 RepID=UPI00224EC3E8|nr:hypothetical protein [Streptomyces sp. NBC_01381]MCX4669636.1 hypothetical protein [Streptomyces sp. NBC_01381]
MPFPDWGTVPTWFSATGTTGALWVGAITLRRAQNKERRSEADAVSCYDGPGGCCGHKVGPGWTVHVSNGSKRPIYNLYAISFDSDTGTMGQAHRLYNVLQPGVSDHEHLTGQRPTWDSPGALLFRDADDTWWIRDLMEQSLYQQHRHLPLGRVPRTRRRLEKEGRLKNPSRPRRGGNGHKAPW